MLSKTTFESRYCREIHYNWIHIDEPLSYKHYLDVQYNVYITLASMGREYTIHEPIRNQYTRPYSWDVLN